MPKAGFVVARVCFLMLAASMLVAGMLAAPTSAWAASGGCTKSNPCSLAFATDGQPTDTVVNTTPGVNATITSRFNSQGGPVKVEVLDDLGQLVTNVKTAVTITLTANPGSGTLSGTTTVNTSGGVASFSNLSINLPGIGYTLTAASRGMNSATSDFFTIWGSLQQCSSPCSASGSTPKTSGTVTTSSVNGSQLLGTGIGGVSYSCTTYQPLSDAFNFDVLDSTTGAAQPSAKFTASLKIDKSVVKSSGHPGASTWQICYAAPQTMPPSFTVRPGTPYGTAVIGGVKYDTGLLPDCSSTQGAPCVQARNKDNAGDVIVTFQAVGDPIGRG